MVDETGNFVKYHGYTVICKLKDPSVLSGVENMIKKSKTLKKYIVPTPSSSYHMTITGLNKDAPLYELKELCDKYSSTMKVSVQDVYFGATPGIALKVPAETSRLRNLLRKTAGMKEENYYYHITFAYRFKNIEPGDYESYTEEVTDIRRYIFSKFPTLQYQIILNKASVYEFEDMTNFQDI